MLLISICTVLVLLVLIYANTTKSVVPVYYQTTALGREKFAANNVVYFLFFSILVLVSTSRFEFIDTYAYKEVYIGSRNDLEYVNSEIWGIEKGWLYFCYLLNFISPSPKLILFVSAFTIIGAYVVLIKKYAFDPVFSMYLFFCLSYLDTNNGIRQYFAAGLLMLTIPLFEKKRIWSYALIALFIFVAFQFHHSSIVFILIIIIAIGKPFNFKVKLTLLFGIVFIFASAQFNEYFEEIIVDVFEDDKYASYLQNNYGMTIARALVTGVVPVVLSIIYHYFSKKDGQDIDRFEDLLVNITVINTVFVFMGTTMQYWARLGMYTSFAMFIMMPKYIDTVFSEKVKPIVKPLAVFLYFIYFAYNIYVNVSYGAMDDFYFSLN